MITRLEEYTRARIAQMGIALDLRLAYHSIEDEESFQNKLTAAAKQEDIYKTTVIGPHRDIILFLDHGRDMRDFSSQGQVRMTILAAKLALAELLHHERGLHPVFLLDDILLEIDPHNAESILAGFGERHQMFFTSTTVPKLDYFKTLPESCFVHLANGAQYEISE
jgi:DNA replication and repair protein RecF